jgi:hypothetical protein
LILAFGPQRNCTSPALPMSGTVDVMELKLNRRQIIGGGLLPAGMVLLILLLRYRTPPR